jgi:uncharacterized membrane protein HdeD (DUF308 family)
MPRRHRSCGPPGPVVGNRIAVYNDVIINSQGNFMSDLPQAPLSRSLRHEIEAIRGNWLWLVLLGASLIVLGLVALSAPVLASVATAVALGTLFFVSGMFEIAGSFWTRHWSGMLVVLLSGILTAVLGFLMVSSPIKADIALTVLIASVLLVGGIFKISAALSHRIGAWLWLVLSGGIDVLLAVVIWQAFPLSSFVVPGVLLGINMVFRGVTWVMIGLTVKKLPAVGAV